MCELWACLQVKLLVYMVMSLCISIFLFYAFEIIACSYAIVIAQTILWNVFV